VAYFSRFIGLATNVSLIIFSFGRSKGLTGGLIAQSGIRRCAPLAIWDAISLKLTSMHIVSTRRLFSFESANSRRMAEVALGALC
jgi:hypothetical protein